MEQRAAADKTWESEHSVHANGPLHRYSRAQQRAVLPLKKRISSIPLRAYSSTQPSAAEHLQTHGHSPSCTSSPGARSPNTCEKCHSRGSAAPGPPPACNMRRTSRGQQGCWPASPPSTCEAAAAGGSWQCPRPGFSLRLLNAQIALGRAQRSVAHLPAPPKRGGRTRLLETVCDQAASVGASAAHISSTRQRQ